MTNLASLWADGPWSPVEVQAELPASPEEVYGLLADPESYPAWLVGAERIQVCAALPAPDPPHHLDLEVRAGPFHGVVDVAIDPGPAGTSRVCFRECATGPFAVFTPLFRPILYARNGYSLRRLADLLATQKAA